MGERLVKVLNQRIDIFRMLRLCLHFHVMPMLQLLRVRIFTLLPIWFSFARMVYFSSSDNT